jgi:YebC/PmpR family DNA-binding regulatory protein
MEKTSRMKSKLYSKFGKKIYMAAKESGPDPDTNLTLRHIIDRAKQNQVPADVINRNIEKSKGNLGEHYEPARYEGFGPSGATLIIECLTDNGTRTFGDVRHCFKKTDNNLGVEGSVSYMYDYRAKISFKGLSEEGTLEAMMANDVDIIDIKREGDVITIIGEPTDLNPMKEALQATGEDLEFIFDESTYIPMDTVELNEEELANVRRLCDMLNEIDDVQDIYTNIDGFDPEQDA